MSGFAEDMADLAETWDATEVQEPSGDFGPQMPDGQHQAIIVAADVRRRQSDDHWQLYLKFQNRTGSIRKWSDFDHEIGLTVAKQDLQVLGWKGKFPDELEKDLPSMVGLVCDINLKTKPGETRDFTNVYVNRCHGPASDPAMFDIDPAHAAAAATGDAEFPPSSADDDIPF